MLVTKGTRILHEWSETKTDKAGVEFAKQAWKKSLEGIEEPAEKGKRCERWKN